MKNLILFAFIFFLTFNLKADVLTIIDANIIDSYEIVSQSQELRAEIVKKRETRAPASLNAEDGDWLEYWRDLMEEPTESPTYWINKSK